ncbi:MAG: hypothetical protein R3B74_07030 [Nitrospirales bacterium]|nr:hypothetical protein [Nitrospirales bacterium]
MDALFYPFHLCHERTLHRLLQKFQAIHFRDFMAMQLTPLAGMTAFPDRMGDYYPDQLQAGNIIQGYHVSGPLSQAMTLLVNRDLADKSWRSTFHQALASDNRFQRGLFRSSSRQAGEEPQSFDDATCLSPLTQSIQASVSYTVESLQAMSQNRRIGDMESTFDYGMALVTTSASLQYTIQLCNQQSLVAATDSLSHSRLLSRSCQRDSMSLVNYCLPREGY